jgi:hypothetical protein
MSKKITIDNDKIQSTQIVVNVKTLSIIVFSIISSIATMYGFLSSDITSARNDSSTQIESLTKTVSKDIEEVKGLVNSLEVIKVEPLGVQFHNLDKQVYYLINRTNSRGEHHTSTHVPEATTPK